MLAPHPSRCSRKCTPPSAPGVSLASVNHGWVPPESKPGPGLDLCFVAFTKGPFSTGFKGADQALCTPTPNPTRSQPDQVHRSSSVNPQGCV